MRNVTMTKSSRRAGESAAGPSDNYAMIERGISEAASSTDRVRLHGRMLMVTPVVSPVPIAVAYVVKGLLSQLDHDEVVVAAERWSANPPDQTHESNGHRVHFLRTKWTWPKRGKRFVVWMRWFLVPWMARRMIKLARAEKCRAIFANFPEDHSLCAAYLAARRLGVRFFPFFHNTYRENRRGIGYWLASWLQKARSRPPMSCSS